MYELHRERAGDRTRSPLPHRRVQRHARGESLQVHSHVNQRAPRGSLVFFDGKIVELTSYHIHIPIDTLLAMTDRELTETLTPGDGVELRAMLVCLKASGKTVFTGSSCDRLGADGACLGHRRG